MEWARVIITAAHWLGVALYFGSLFFLIIIFQKVYGRYRSYKYVDNFRAEIITLYWKFLHIAFAVIVVSGAILTGLGGRSVLRGYYGLVFSTKLALWLAQIYFTQETLKPFIAEVEAGTPQVASRPVPPAALITLLFLISLCGFTLKLL